MKSIRDIYKIGRGPSSSHTMGPQAASIRFAKKYPQAAKYKVILYGSLAKTGKGHLTDVAINEVLPPSKTEIIFCMDYIPLPHENTMDFFAYDANGAEIGYMRIMSIGGGDIAEEGEVPVEAEDVYKENTFAEIAAYCKKRNIRISDYVEENEGESIWAYLSEVWECMRHTIHEGLTTTGVLAGGLGVERKAAYLYNQRHIDESKATRETRIVCSYAFAASEQNAGGGIMVTAPTCGASGVLPAVLKYKSDTLGYSEDAVLRALAVAGVIGNLVKRNASVSGAECGCQAEIGTACSMAAAALAELFDMGIDQIEYAAEIAMEHHLGLTCDPVCGLVQIPCIERNAVAAMRAINAVTLASFLTFTRKISFDNIIETMYETGKDLHERYRETSEGGLAKLYRQM
ncbi:MAG: L-serine ammonia-lyase, iron-sulfur-dependent, subunit alpha [Clostridia bacterium]|nr:L-serine ammonia-lyase, iron-sulfur-dependent, subunit alpha [Clostridia bacterium]